MSKSEIFYIAELGDDIRVRVLSYNDHIGVDIRKWKTSSTYTSAVPTKNGIRLTPQNWTRLLHEMRNNTIELLSDKKQVSRREDRHWTSCLHF